MMMIMAENLDNHEYLYFNLFRSQVRGELRGRGTTGAQVRLHQHHDDDHDDGDDDYGDDDDDYDDYDRLDFINMIMTIVSS